MRYLLLTFLLIGCAAQSAIPLGNNMMQIDVSGDIVHRRADIQRMAFERAAKATIEAGFDKFIVVENKAWTEKQSSGVSYGTFDGDFDGTTFDSDGWEYGIEGTDRMAETTMVIKMFHSGDLGSKGAIDARQYITN